MKKEKTWNMIGMALGIISILVGIVFCLTPPDHYSTKSVEEASFGADFYTYEYDATRAAAVNAAITANNIRELGEKIAIYAGTLFIVMGTLILICYGKKCFCVNSEPQSSVAPEIEKREEYAAEKDDTSLNL